MTLTVDQARTLVGLKAGDASRDVRLTQLIGAAYEQAAYWCGPQTATTVTETARVRRGQVLLRRAPVTALTAVGGYTDLSALRIGRGSGLVDYLPSAIPDGDVTVTYVSGYATYPASVEEGVRAWVRNRWSLESYGTDTYGEVDTPTDFAGLPNAVRNAWQPFVLAERVLGIA